MYNHSSNLNFKTELLLSANSNQEMLKLIWQQQEKTRK